MSDEHLSRLHCSSAGSYGCLAPSPEALPDDEVDDDEDDADSFSDDEMTTSQ